jgi:hypothetical protein
MSEYLGKYDKKRIVKLFVENIIWGNISINSFAFQMDGRVGLTRSLEQKIIGFQKNPTEQTIDWIYKAIIKLRINGALSYELRDLSKEEMINGLRETIRQKENENERLHSENVVLANELHNTREELHNTKTPPMNKDFSAHR